MITKKEFVSVIESMNDQFRHDKDYSFLVQSLFKTEDASLYDNDKLTTSLLLLLRKYFPVVDDFCEISHYCYVLDFGKNGDDYESAEEFYDRLYFKNQKIASELFQKEREDCYWCKKDSKKCLKHYAADYKVPGAENYYSVDRVFYITEKGGEFKEIGLTPFKEFEDFVKYTVRERPYIYGLFFYKDKKCFRAWDIEVGFRSEDKLPNIEFE